jgi:hypothetical protein
MNKLQPSGPATKPRLQSSTYNRESHILVRRQPPLSDI